MSDKDRRGDRPKEKRSWRDIDAQRDRNRSSGSSSSSGGPARPGNTSDATSRQHRAALEALFAKGEVGKLAERMGAPAASTLRPAPIAAAAAAPAPPPTPSPETNARLLLRKKILEAVGRDPITRAVDKYVDAHGLPADFEVLEQALEHLKEARVIEVLTKLESLLEKERPRRSRTLAGKLRFLEETSPDEELRTRAARIRSKLG